MSRFLSILKRSNSSRHRHARPQVESLEGRQLLSAGDLDLTFGGGTGSVLTTPDADPSEHDADRANVVQILGDGSILVAGDNAFPADKIGLVKLRPDGALDSSFGTGGRVLTGLSLDGVTLTNPHLTAMAVQADGKIVIAGYVDNGRAGKGLTYTYNWDFLVARYNANGTLDTSFGPAGTGWFVQNVSTATSSDSKSLLDWAYAVALQADGKILVGGYSYGGASTAMDSSLARYNSDGTLDSSFGTGGKVLTAFGAGNDEIRDLAVLPNGKILARGRVADAAGKMTVYVARYLDNGTVDTSFGTAGVATLFPSSDTSAGTGSNMNVDPSDGSITVVGTTPGATSSDIALARLTVDGLPDTGFGVGGMSVVGTSANEYVSAIARQPDGRIVAAGYSQSGSGSSALVARFDANGALDPAFGVGGLSLQSFGVDQASSLNDVTIKPDGKIVAVGQATAAVTRKYTDRDFLIARFEGDSSPLLAAAMPVARNLIVAQALPTSANALTPGVARGASTSRLGYIDHVIEDLWGDRLGDASGFTVKPDGNAARWGWNVKQGGTLRSTRMDRFSALTHAIGQ